jgi:hypothetical protein
MVLVEKANKKEGKMRKMGMYLWISCLVLALGIGPAQAEQKQPIKETKPPTFQREQKAPPRFPDAGGEEVVPSEVDLVVSKVEITKGTFAGEAKIQIKPFIKNMWRGRTAQRIKIYFGGLGAAIWLEGGIGANEEKMGGAYYLPLDAAHWEPIKFSVEVDNDRVIPETNETNNTCGPIIFDVRSEHSKIHNCPIRGPHEPLR